VIDIKVNHSVISQGEFIAPEKIQNVYLRSPFIAQVFVYGNSYKVSFRGRLGLRIRGPRALRKKIFRDISISLLTGSSRKGLTAAERAEKELAKRDVAEREWGGGWGVSPFLSPSVSSLFSLLSSFVPLSLCSVLD